MQSVHTEIFSEVWKQKHNSKYAYLNVNEWSNWVEKASKKFIKSMWSCKVLANEFNSDCAVDW